MEKEKITVNENGTISTTMWAETIPVHELFRKSYVTSEENSLSASFILLECDGLYLVINRKILREGEVTMDYKGFIHQRDAVDYIEIHGIDTGIGAEEEDHV